jgi:hypothetical protein
LTPPPLCMTTSRGDGGQDVLLIKKARLAPRRWADSHCSALVLVLISGGGIIGWPQVNVAFIGIIILPNTPALPSIEDRCNHGFVVLF